MKQSSSHRTAFVLQGGGALGAYQAGSVCRLDKAGIRPDLVAGISIGAINAALIAGNPPERRAERLTAFWERISRATALPGLDAFGPAMALTVGAPGFFAPRLPPAALAPPGDPARASVYDTSPLRATLEALVDFDLLNDGPVRLVVGAVNVATGNFVWFDSAERRIGPEHIMASGALPPGFAPVGIEGEWFWDGGLVSNTPLARVVETRATHAPLVIWQMDLFSARGPVPHSVWAVEAREKDIRFSSRTRLNTDMQKRIEALEAAAARLAERLPPEFADDADLATLTAHAQDGPVTILHLINRSEDYETQNKDYEFSRMTAIGHWENGRRDVERSFASPRWKNRKWPQRGIVTLDLA